MSDLAKELVMYRAKYRLTQNELAKKCGVSTQTISLAERGLQKPNRVTLAKIKMVIGGNDESQHIAD